MSCLKTLLVSLAVPLALVACAPVQTTSAIPSGGVQVLPVATPVAASVPSEAGHGSLRVHPHPTHPSFHYEAQRTCTSWNTAYTMDARAAYTCAEIYVPGASPTYRFVVLRDAHGNAYITGADGRWVRSPAHDLYVQGDQPHR